MCYLCLVYSNIHVVHAAVGGQCLRCGWSVSEVWVVSVQVCMLSVLLWVVSVRGAGGQCLQCVWSVFEVCMLSVLLWVVSV